MRFKRYDKASDWVWFRSFANCSDRLVSCIDISSDFDSGQPNLIKSFAKVSVSTDSLTRIVSLG